MFPSCPPKDKFHCVDRQKNCEHVDKWAWLNIENKLEEIIKQAKSVGITLEEGIEIFKSIYEEV